MAIIETTANQLRVVADALAGCGKTPSGRKEHTSGAKAQAIFQGLIGTTEVVPFPQQARRGATPE